MRLSLRKKFWLLILPLMISGAAGMARAQSVEVGVGGTGAVKLGAAVTCDGTMTGSIRYNSLASGSIDFCNGTAWVNVSTGATTSLSSLTAAAAINTTENANYAQIWNWNTLSTQTALSLSANAITSGKILYISSAATGFTGTMQDILLSGSNAANTGTLLKSSVTGTLSNAIPLMVTNLGAGTSFRVNDQTGDADTTPFVIDASGNIGIGIVTPQAVLDIAGTDAILLPRGQVSNRPVSPINGMLRYNSVSNKFEGYQAGIWQDILTGSAAAASPDRAIQFNSNGSFAADSNLVFSSQGALMISGSYTGATTLPASGSGTRMFFDPGKSAFRAGTVSGTHWNYTSTGNYSTALGYNTVASNSYSTAMGFSTTASNLGTTAMGNSSIASGGTSTAMGFTTTASGQSSTAMGDTTTASGTNSTATGNFTVASGVHSTATGRSTTASGYNSTTFGNSVTAGNGAAGSGFGDGSMALGLIDDAVTITANSQVRGIQSMGIFMGDQDGLTMTANSTMGLFGGTMVIDPRVPALQLAARGTLDLGAGTDALVLPLGATGQRPGSPVNGMIRYNSTTNKFEGYQNSGWVDMISVGSTTIPLSSLTSAAAINTTENANYAQIWNWNTLSTETALSLSANAITSGKILYISSAATGFTGTMQDILLSGSNAGNTGTLLKSSVTGTLSNAIPLMVTNLGAGTSFRVNDQTGDADTTPFVIDASGYVGIGITTPQAVLDIAGTDAILLPRGQVGNRPASPINGMLRYNSVSNKFEGYQAGSWQDILTGSAAAASPDRGIQFNSGGTFAADANLVYSSMGAFMVSGTYTGAGAPPVTGAGTRMFFDPTKAAFRAGTSVSGTEWNNANIGNYSTAMGYGTIASGLNSTALGNATIASGISSTAMGNGTAARGIDSMALGVATIASGTRSMAMGAGVTAGNGTGNNSIGDASFAIGLIDDAVAITSSSQITGIQSMGIFMGDQDGLTMSASNTMGLFGGTMVIDPRVPAQQLSARGVIDVGAATDAIVLPLGTTGQRPGSPVNGMVRYNSTTAKFEGYQAGSWRDILTSGGNVMAIDDLTDAITNYTSSIMYLGSGSGAATTTASGNLGLGVNTLSTNVGKLDNVAIGHQAMQFADSTASGTYGYNTAIGIRALQGSGVAANNTGTQNTTVGHSTMSLNTTGAFNAALGFAALNQNTTGNENTGIGGQSLLSNTVGISNTAIGANSLASNVAGSESVAVGGNAMVRSNSTTTPFVTQNTAVGWSALTGGPTASLNTGIQNTAIGHRALTSVTSGSANTALGTSAADAINTGVQNTAIGYDALSVMTSGTANTALGFGAGSTLTNGVRNIMIGFNTVPANPSGSFQLNIGDSITGDMATGTLAINGTGALTLPIGQTGNRPSGINGMLRYNSVSNKFEGYQAGSWQDILTGSAAASSPDRGIQFNSGGSFAANANFSYSSQGVLSVAGTYSGANTTPLTGAGTRMYFDPAKSAFRVGTVSSGQWDYASTGNYSIAMGRDTTALGDRSFATGSGTVASGVQSTAMGVNSIASGLQSTAMGVNTIASGGSSTAMGSTTLASGSGSTAMGYLTVAPGDASTAMGISTIASGYASVAMGKATTASGYYGIAMGRDVTSGNGVALSGFGNGSMAVGLIADTYTITTPSQVRGFQSYGIFMGDQDGLVMTANNTMGLFGGQLVIDPAVPATQLSARGVIDVGAATDAIVLPLGATGQRPGSPVNGMIRYNSTTAKFEGYQAGAWVNMVGGGGGTFLSLTDVPSSYSGEGGKYLRVNTGATAVEFTDEIVASVSGAPAPATPNLDDLGDVVISSPTNGQGLVYSSGNWVNGTLSASASLSGLSVASATNTLDNLNFAQTWNWSTLNTQTALSSAANAITSGKMINLSSTATAFTGTMFDVTLSGSNAANTGTLMKSSVTGTSSVAVPLMVTNLGTGASFRVNDQTGDADTTPFLIDASGNVGIGMTGPSVALDVAGDIEYTGSITDVSDRRLKNDILPLHQRGSMLEKLGMIDTYSYTMKDDTKKAVEFGVMAQDLKQIFPELVRTDMSTPEQYMSVNYVGMIAPMIEATKELKAENDALKAKLASVEQRMASIEGDMNGMKAHTGYGINKAGFEFWMLLLMTAIIGASATAIVIGSIRQSRKRG